MTSSSIVSRLAGALLLLAAVTLPASADDPLSVSVGPQGSLTYNVGLAVAKAASVHDGMDLRLRPYKSTSQAVGFVDTGEINFGLENSLGLQQAFTGTGAYDGAALKNIRLVATLVPFRSTFGVRKNDPAQTIMDLKGRTLAKGFRGAVIGEPLIKAFLATVGMSYDDVKTLEVSDLTEQSDQFIAGNVDAYTEVLGSARDDQLEQDLGGIRALPLGTGPDVLDKIHQFLPTARLYTQMPEAGLIGVYQPTPVLEYDYYVYANVNVPDAEIVKLLDAIRNGKDDMVAIVTSFRWFDPAKMATDIGLPYHPAAEAYYKANGLWPTP